MKKRLFERPAGLLLTLLLSACAAPKAPPVATLLPASTTEAAASSAPTVVATATPWATATPMPLASAPGRLAATRPATATATESPTGAPGLSVRLVTPAHRPPWRYEILGYSVRGQAIEAFHFGDGPDEIVFVGGQHGGYEWNTILLAYAVADYFSAYPEEIPAGVTLTIIPSANPDGQQLVTGKVGRFTPDDVGAATEIGRVNSRGVDLNRNWDCDWSPDGVWGTQWVSGGTAPFSEPENRALRNYFLRQQPRVVLFWHSAAPGVFYGRCGATPLVDTVLFGDAFAAAAGYAPSDTFEAYIITGDASNYLASVGIPAFAVELSTHDQLDLNQNLAGVQALLALLGG